MSLFTGNLRRSVGAGLASVLTGTLLMWTLPSNLRAFTLAQTSVAILAIGFLMILNGTIFTQDQEELILIVTFGLFWFALLVAWRAMRLRWNFEGEIGMGGTSSPPRREAGFTRSTRRAWPCSRYDDDCVVEEWSYY